MQHDISSKEKSFAEIIEERWADESEALEEKHLDAAIDAKIAEIDTNHDGTRTTLHQRNESVVSKSNCYSPYVPSRAQRIIAMIEFVVLTPDDVLVDMGCGDGRVCYVASHMMMEQHQHVRNSTPTSLHMQSSLMNFRSIGIDVSSDCIALARQQLMNAKDSSQQNDVDIASYITFHQTDLTLDPSVILCASTTLGKDLLSATVVYLYTYPTLLIQLIPLLSRLFEIGRLRAVVTLTYHIHNLQQQIDLQWTAKLETVDNKHDLCLYTNVSLIYQTSDIAN